MHRYFIELSYLGSGFQGWQIQARGQTVQKVLNEALSLLLKEEVRTTGAGRTDAGVHARYFVAHFDTKERDLHRKDDLVYHLNSVLPPGIAIRQIRPVKDRAHARFDALSRSYEYLVCRGKAPFLQGQCYPYFGALDLKSMRETCSILLRHNDFKSFSRLHSNNRTTLCRIDQAEWLEEEGLLIFRITADRFLRNMVRAVVGTMLEVGRGKSSPDEFEKVILARDRNFAGPSVPPQGLYLTGIAYPPEIYL